MAEDIFFYDSKENIDKCLKCNRPRCTNCMARKGLSLARDKIDPDKFLELYKVGWTYPAIGRYFDVSRSVVSNYCKTMGLVGRRKANARS